MPAANLPAPAPDTAAAVAAAIEELERLPAVLAVTRRRLLAGALLPTGALLAILSLCILWFGWRASVAWRTYERASAAAAAIRQYDVETTLQDGSLWIVVDGKDLRQDAKTGKTFARGLSR